MYVQGVSTRRVSSILSQLAGTLEISASQVSRASAQLNEQLEIWRNRPLNEIPYPYIILDARYEKVRRDGVVLDCAVLMAIGIDATGHRTILGVCRRCAPPCGLPFGRLSPFGRLHRAERTQTHWRDFLASLLERGLHGTTFIVSDDHPGLKAARSALFPAVPWQRCQFILRQTRALQVGRQSRNRESCYRSR